MKQSETITTTCTDCSALYYIPVQEQVFLHEKDFPLPTLCPRCRHQKRMLLRNERVLFKRTCDKCHKDIISTYRPESTFIVYCPECYWEYVT